MRKKLGLFTGFMTFAVVIFSFFFFAASSSADSLSGIYSAGVVIREDLTLIVEANLIDSAHNPEMSFTRAGEEIKIEGTYNTESGRWSFEYEGLYAQCITDRIDIKLIVNNEVLDSVSYSLQSYFNELYHASASELNLSETAFLVMKNTLADILEYGAAAQIYAGYNTSVLANNLPWVSEEKTAPFLSPVSDFSTIVYSYSPSDALKSANLMLSNTVRIGISFVAEKATKVIITGNDRQWLYEKSAWEGEGGVFRIETPGIYAPDFDEVFTITLMNDIEVFHEITYSVNTYVSSKKDSEDENLSKIVRALYNYGKSADKYVSEVEKKDSVPTIRISSVEASPLDKDVAVEITVCNNPGIAAMLLDIEYNDELVALTGFDYNDELSGSKTAFNPDAGKQSVYWCDLNNKNGDFVFVTLHFEILENASAVIPVSVSYDPDNIYDSEEKNVGFVVEGGTITISQSQGEEQSEPIEHQSQFPIEPDGPAFVLTSQSARPGDEEVAVTVNVVNNPGIAAILLDLVYSKDDLTLTGYTYNPVLQGSVTPFNQTAAIQSVYWCNLTEINGDFEFVTLYFTVSSEAKGIIPVSVAYDPDNVYDGSEKNVDFQVVSGFINVE
ncbi:MAG: hypothetical protein IJS22_01505 [Lachnospiraceae bacterium]|nr:hypothetical protein [Lachnospiraceae bacterium]